MESSLSMVLGLALRGMYLGPPCPSVLLMAKSICILVTSGGSIAAPGPTLIASSCEKGQLGLVMGMRSCLCKKVPSTKHKLSALEATLEVVSKSLTALSFFMRFITLTILHISWGYFVLVGSPIINDVFDAVDA